LPWTFVLRSSLRTFVRGLLPGTSIRGPCPTCLCPGPLSTEPYTRPSWPSHETSLEWPSPASLHHGTFTSQPYSGPLSQHWCPPCSARINFFESEGLNLWQPRRKGKDLGWKVWSHLTFVSCGGFIFY
jgi:hypothetical protein